MKYFITSDVHSYYNELMAALKHQGFEKDNPEHTLICIGDLFDRGPGTVELYKFCRELGDRFIYIRGNHENLLFDLLYEVAVGVTPGYHHLTNGTVETVEALTKIPIHLWKEKKDWVLARMAGVRDWIIKKTVNYLEIGDLILTHGWVPPTLIEDRASWDLPENRPLWNDAMWLNGMEWWGKGAVIPDKTIVCGHWHTSWARYHQGEIPVEFPGRYPNQATPQEMRKAFAPWMAPGIIALDSCVAHSGFLNVITVEV